MRLFALVPVLAALALPAVAGAKEVSALDVCGTDGCTRIATASALRAFEEGGAMAAAAPSGPQRSYRIRVHVRIEGGSEEGWNVDWLPRAGLLAFRGEDGSTAFSPVEPRLERVLRGAARGHKARAAHRYARNAEPVARVAEVLPAPASHAAARADDGGGLPSFAWIGVATGLLLVGGAVRARRR
jgi:hypothetical protein